MCAIQCAPFSGALQLGLRNSVCLLEHLLGQVFVRQRPEHVLVRHVPDHVLRYMFEHILRPCPGMCSSTCSSNCLPGTCLSMCLGMCLSTCPRTDFLNHPPPGPRHHTRHIGVFWLAAVRRLSEPGPIYNYFVLYCIIRVLHTIFSAYWNIWLGRFGGWAYCHREHPQINQRMAIFGLFQVQ